jgi:hypothetical protein
VVVWFEAAAPLPEDEDWEFVQLFILFSVVEGSGSMTSGSEDEEQQPGQ